MPAAWTVLTAGDTVGEGEDIVVGKCNHLHFELTLREIGFSQFHHYGKINILLLIALGAPEEEEEVVEEVDEVNRRLVDDWCNNGPRYEPNSALNSSSVSGGGFIVC